MVKEAPGPINFTMFLTIFGDRAQGTDDEQVILNAFAQYDEGDGTCGQEVLKHSLTTWGEKFTVSEVHPLIPELTDLTVDHAVGDDGVRGADGGRKDRHQEMG